MFRNTSLQLRSCSNRCQPSPILRPAYPSYYVPGAAAAAATTGYVAGAATAYGLNWAWCGL
jgi:hypothetical protein